MKKIQKILKQALRKSAQNLTEDKQLLTEITAVSPSFWTTPYPPYYDNHQDYWNGTPCQNKIMWPDTSYYGYAGQGTNTDQWDAIGFGNGAGNNITSGGIVATGNIPLSQNANELQACSLNAACRSNWDDFIFPQSLIPTVFGNRCITPGGEDWGGLTYFTQANPYNGGQSTAHNNVQDMIQQLTDWASPGGIPYVTPGGVQASNNNDYFTALAVLAHCLRYEDPLQGGVYAWGECCTNSIYPNNATYSCVSDNPGNSSGAGYRCTGCDNDDAESYNCEDCKNPTPGTGNCVDPGDGSGTYSIPQGHPNPLQACEDDCLPCITFDCVQGLCEENIAGTGVHATLSDCIASQDCDRWECQKPGAPCIKCNDTQYDPVAQTWDPVCVYTDQADCEKECQPKPCADFMAAPVSQQQACCGKCVGNPPVYTGPAGDFCDTLHESCDCCPTMVKKCKDFNAWANALPGGTSSPVYSNYCGEICPFNSPYPVILSPTTYTFDPVNGVEYCDCCESTGDMQGCLDPSASNGPGSVSYPNGQCCDDPSPSCTPTTSIADCCKYDVDEINCICCQNGFGIGWGTPVPASPGCSVLNGTSGLYNCTSNTTLPLHCGDDDWPDDPIDAPILDEPTLEPLQEGVQIKGKLLNSSRMSKLAGIKKKK